jgi:hypothetical protein
MQSNFLPFYPPISSIEGIPASIPSLNLALFPPPLENSIVPPFWQVYQVATPTGSALYLEQRTVVQLYNSPPALNFPQLFPNFNEQVAYPTLPPLNLHSAFPSTPSESRLDFSFSTSQMTDLRGSLPSKSTDIEANDKPIKPSSGRVPRRKKRKRGHNNRDVIYEFSEIKRVNKNHSKLKDAPEELFLHWKMRPKPKQPMACEPLPITAAYRYYLEGMGLLPNREYRKAYHFFKLALNFCAPLEEDLKTTCEGVLNYLKQSHTVELVEEFLSSNTVQDHQDLCHLLLERTLSFKQEDFLSYAKLKLQQSLDFLFAHLCINFTENFVEEVAIFRQLLNGAKLYLPTRVHFHEQGLQVVFQAREIPPNPTLV